jgi:gliding motility-associated-like protein
MNQLLHFIILITGSISFIQAQNLVVNPSFEDYDTCVLNTNNINYPYILNWNNATLTEYSIYNYCSINFGQNPNTATFGPQIPRTGNGYIMVVYHNDISGVPMGTFIQGRLNMPLIKDSFYCYKMYLSIPRDVRLAIDRIGVYFSDTVINENSYYFPYSTPHIESPAYQFFNNTSDWMKYQGIYKAEGGEQYFTFGNFHLYPNTNTLSFGVPWGHSADSTAYYYIDDVSIELLPSYYADINIGNDSILCDTTGFNHTLNVSAIYDSVKWNTGETAFQININRIGIYSVTTYIGDCEVKDTVTFSLFNYNTLLPLPDIIGCEIDTPVTLYAPSGFDSYSWNTGDTSHFISVTQAGIYSFTATNQCVSYSDTFEVTLFAMPLPPLTIDTALCEGSEAIVASAIGNNLKWYNNMNDTMPLNTTPIIETENKATWRYYVSQTENNCESNKAVYTAIVNALPQISLGEDQTFCRGTTATLTVKHDSLYSYLWNTEETTHFIQVNETGIYKCTVSNNCGSAADEVIISFLECNDCLYVPNAFSPNSDGVNDEFQAYTHCPLKDFYIQICNRWGEKVFETNDISISWNGMYKNREAQTGVYVYHLIYVFENNRLIKQKGSITLIR